MTLIHWKRRNWAVEIRWFVNDFNFFADDVIKLGRPFNFRRVALDHFYILCKFQVFATDS